MTSGSKCIVLAVITISVTAAGARARKAVANDRDVVADSRTAPANAAQIINNDAAMPAKATRGSVKSNSFRN